jgi:hypothetical protein
MFVGAFAKVSSLSFWSKRELDARVSAELLPDEG